MLGIRWFWCSVMWPENLAATRSDVGIRRPMRISGRRVHLCFQESNLLYFHLDFKLPQLFPSIYSPKPMYIGLKAGKYHGRMISPSDQFLVCKHPKVKKKKKKKMLPLTDTRTASLPLFFGPKFERQVPFESELQRIWPGSQTKSEKYFSATAGDFASVLTPNLQPQASSEEKNNNWRSLCHCASITKFALS